MARRMTTRRKDLYDRTRCEYCGASTPRDERTLDHDPPKSVCPGGPYTYRMACKPCNGLKATRTAAEFFAWLATPRGHRWIHVRAEEALTGVLDIASRHEILGSPYNNSPGARALDE